MPSRRRGRERSVGVLVALASVLTVLGLTAAPAAGAEQAFTLAMVADGGEVTIGADDHRGHMATPTTLAGTVDDATGALDDVVLATPPIAFPTIAAPFPTVLDATLQQVGTGTGQVDGFGNLAVSVDVLFELHLLGPGGAVTECASGPLTLDLASTAPWDAGTQTVTLADEPFTIPPIDPAAGCDPDVAVVLDDLLASPHNAISLTVAGALPLPEPASEPTTTALSADVATTPLGQPVTLIAEVTPSDATGQVTFSHGSTRLGQAPVEAGGTATLTTSGLPVGANQVTARYGGSSSYAPSVSAVLVHTVTAVPTVTADLPPAIVVGGDPVGFTATVGNPSSGASLSHLRVDLALGDLSGLAPAHVVLEHDDDGDDTYTPVVLDGDGTLVGSYGGLTGFALAPGEEREIPFRITLAADAPEGPLPVQVELSSVDGTTGDVETVLSTATATTSLVPASRRPTELEVEHVRGLSGASVIRAGDSLHVSGYATRIGPDPLPPISGDVEVLIDGKVVAVSSDPLGLEPPSTRIPISCCGYVDAYITGGGDSLTAGLAPGAHVVSLRYLGDDRYRPSLSAPETFYVLPWVGERYACSIDLLVLQIPLTARIDVQADLPAAAPAGTTVDAGRLEVSYHLEAFGLMVPDAPEAYADPTIAVTPGGTGTFSHTEPGWSANPYEDTVDLVGETIVDIPIEGEPGDVVEVGIEGFAFGIAAGPGGTATVSCVAEGDPEVVGSVVVAGTTLAADAAGPFAPGAAVPLTATVHPEAAQGMVELLAGEQSLGVARIDDGVARFAATGLATGTHTLTARYRGDLVNPPTTSNAVEVVVRDAIRCADQAQPGHAATVRAAYLLLLGRCGEPAGFAYWVDALEGGMSATRFAQSIADSLEAHRHSVDAAYRTVLDRAAEPGGLAYWAPVLDAGGRYDALIGQLAASPELWAQAGGTPEGWVDLIYERLLGRAPDADGRAYWLDRLAASNRARVAAALVRLREPAQKLVADAYLAILGRVPTPTEREAAGRIFQSTGDRGRTYADLIGTAEFATRAATYPNP